MLVVILQKLFVIYILLFVAVVIIRKTLGKTASSGDYSETVVVKGRITSRNGDPKDCLYFTMENGVEYKLIGDCRRELASSCQDQVISIKGNARKEIAGGPEATAVFYVTDIIKD